MPHRFYPDSQNIDLRDEFASFLFGDVENPGIGRPILLRRIRDEKCVCWDEPTGSPDPVCKYCQGEGYQFEETQELAYIARNFGSVQNPSSVIIRQNFLQAYGFTDEQRALAFVQHTVFPNYERYLLPDHPTYDKLYELKVDSNGALFYPVTRVAKWKIRSVTPHHGDFGRVEFAELGLEKENL